MIDFLKDLNQDQFVSKYLTPAIPVKVEGCLNRMISEDVWSFEALIENHGEEMIQVYNELFVLKNIMSLKEYVEDFIYNKNDQDGIHYARLYSKLKDVDYFWSDKIFEDIQNKWDLPDFIPQSGYLLPFSESQISPVNVRFPGRVIFLSPAGAKTSLHQDPWSSDAILAQFVGSKEVVFFPPDTELSSEEMNQAIEERADVTNKYRTIISPGDILYIPRGWHHHVVTTEDSVSISWNFVHNSSVPTLTDLKNSGKFTSEDDLEVFDFFSTEKYLI